MFFKKQTADKKPSYSDVQFSLDEENKFYNITYIQLIEENCQFRFERKEIKKPVAEVEKILERIIKK